MTKAAEKRNRTEQSLSGKYSVPLDLTLFGDKRLSANTRLVMSVLRGFSVNGGTSEFSYEKLARDYGISRASVGRALKAVRESGRFSRGERVGQYRFNFDENVPKTQSHIEVRRWLHFATVTANGRTSRLTQNEINLLSFLRGYSPNGFTATKNYLAKRLGVSCDTVCRSLDRLEAAKLIGITYPQGLERCVNEHTRAVFKAKENKIAQLKSTLVKQEKERKDAAARATDERAERERYYARRKAEEEDRIGAIRRDVAAERPDFTAAGRELNVLEAEIGKAQASRNFARLRELMERRIERKAQWRGYLEALGYSEADLQPRYLCSECKDTGERADHTFCDCWRRSQL